MAKLALATRLARKDSNKQRIADDVIRQPGQTEELLDCVSSDRPTVKYGAAKVLRLIGDQSPDVLYNHVDFFIDQLDSDNNILHWEALYVLGCLAAVDSKKKIDKILDELLQPISGPVLVTAANIVGSATKIALAKPNLTERIVKGFGKVEKASYKTPMCRHVCLGHVVQALHQLMPQIERKSSVVKLVRRQADSPRPATVKKAERFLKKWDKA